MKIKYNENGNYTPCPEYNGIAKIVDYTDLQEYSGKFGIKRAFRFILEVKEEKSPGVYYTVATKPLTPSFHEKASLRKFVESVFGRPMRKDELLCKDGYDTESLIGKYCHVIVEHTKSEDGQKTWANIQYVGKPKSNDTWESKYVRLGDRPDRKESPSSRDTLKQRLAELEEVQGEDDNF